MLPEADVALGVGSGSHAWQTAQVMLRFEPVLLESRPDLVLVVGDVNSTLACALTCAKLGIAVGHVEAGLRSFDRTMPEEYNRLLTDQVAEVLFTPSRDADDNLRREGVPEERIHFVGNVMIDTLVRFLPQALPRWQGLQAKYNVSARQRYVLATLYRPANVGDPAILREIVSALGELSRTLPVIFPVHPRTRQRLVDMRLQPETWQVQLTEPLGYVDFLALQKHARLVLTDSGGVQEETTYLGVPCLTLRPTTERPVTLTQGTNRLVASKREALLQAAHAMLNADRPGGDTPLPPLWDGREAERIVQILRSWAEDR